MNSWPRSEAAMTTVNFEDNLSAKDIIFSDIPASLEGVYIFYNPPLESATNEICVNSAKPVANQS